MDDFISFLIFCFFIWGLIHIFGSDKHKKTPSPSPTVVEQPQTDTAIAAKVDAEVEQLIIETERKKREEAKAEALRLETARKEQNEADKKEKMRLEALNNAEILGRLLVKNYYGGGSNIGANLIDYEYFESESTYRLKVELSWNSTRCNESGRASATGVITAVFDEHGQQKNADWNPESQSDTLNEWLAKRRDPGEKMNNMAIQMLGQMSGGVVSPCE